MIEKQQQEGVVLKKYLSSLQRILNESFGCDGQECDSYGMKRLFEDYAQQISLSTLELTLYDSDYLGIKVPLRPLYCLYCVIMTYIVSMPEALNSVIYVGLLPVLLISILAHFKVVSSPYTILMMFLYSAFASTLVFCYFTGGIFSPGLEGLLMIPLLGSKTLVLDTLVSFASMLGFTVLYLFGYLPPSMLTRDAQNTLSFLLLMLSGTLSSLPFFAGIFSLSRILVIQYESHKDQVYREYFRKTKETS